MNIVLNFRAMTPWAKIMLFVTLGKAFVAGAGIGLATLGVVDLAGRLGVQPMVDFVQREHVLDMFAYGGGIISVIGQITSVAWKALTR